MREEGNLLIFDYPGGQITFHKDLKKYYDIRNELWEERNNRKAGINEKAEPSDIQSRLSVLLLDYIQKDLIAPLANYGLYDVTTEDFLVENPGYHDLLLATQKHYEYAIALEDAMTSAAAKDKDQAAEIASQSITGMGFGVISNDWVAHALYAAQSKSVMDKQVAQAQARYNSMAATIDSTTRSATNKGIEKYKTDTYLPAVRKSIDAIFEYVLSKYCDFLSKAGQFDKKCLDGIDEDRSNSVLSNLDVVQDKEKIIYGAIQLCPYNLDIYKNIYKFELSYNTLHKEILDYFGLKDVFCDWLIEIYSPKDFDFIYKYRKDSDYQSFTRLINAVSLLSGKTLSQVAHILFDSKLNIALSKYIHLGQRINRRAPIHTEFSGLRNSNPEELTCCILQQLSAIHFPKAAIDFFRSIDLDIFQKLSEFFKTPVASFEDVDKIVLAAWEKERDTVAAEVKQKKSQERIKERVIQLDNLKKKREDVRRQLCESKKWAGLIGYIVCSVVGAGLILFPFLLGVLEGESIFLFLRSLILA